MVTVYSGLRLTESLYDEVFFMSEFVDKLLTDLLSAKRKLISSSDARLFSYVAKVEACLALQFFHVCDERYRGNRFFWQSANRQLTFAGAGSCEVLLPDANHQGRFQEVGRDWQRLIGTSDVYGLSEIDATGPIGFGGFSFFDQVAEGGVWSDFSAGLFYLPRFLLTEHDKGCFLTATILLESCTDEQDLMTFAEESERLIIQAGHVDPATCMPKMIDRRDVSSEHWLASVSEAVRYMQDDPVALQKVVLARSIELAFAHEIPVELLLQNLSELQLGSTIFCLERYDKTFVGATPERLVSKSDFEMNIDGLAGTVGRGRSQAEDEQLATYLLNDTKNREEHQLVVDYIRMVIADRCVSIDIPGKPQVRRSRHVQHLHTPIVGKLKRDVSIFKLVEDLHPTPALGGTPVTKALEQIATLEKIERGLFASPIGWIDRHGNGEFVVGIRSGLIEGKCVTLFAGCGVVSESVPKDEFAETETKFKPMLSALGVC